MTFAMVVSVGFLLAVGLVGSFLVGHLNERLVIIFPQGALVVFHILNLLVGFIVITLAFNLIFKILPAGKLAFRDCFAGASFTAFLFLLGKFTIGIYLGTQNITSVYGAAGSIIVILCWIYYSAAILYFGAEFTKVYAHAHEREITPKSYSAASGRQND
jgi:membrane protein